jgi:hypothetical protein
MPILVFNFREPLAAVHGAPSMLQSEGCTMRPASAADLPASNTLCTRAAVITVGCSGRAVE